MCTHLTIPGAESLWGDSGCKYHENPRDTRIFRGLIENLVDNTDAPTGCGWAYVTHNIQLLTRRTHGISISLLDEHKT